VGWNELIVVVIKELQLYTSISIISSNSSKMDRTQCLQQQDDDGDSSSLPSSSSSSSQPIDDSDGYILDEDYVDHDEEIIINESLKEVMVE